MADEELALADLTPEEFKAEFRSAREALTDAEQLVLHANGTGNSRYINEASEELRLADGRLKEFRKERGRRFWKKKGL